MNNTTIKQAGLDRNGHGRLYRRGAEYNTAQKLEFEELYWQMVTSGGGKHPSVRIFARECRVGRTFANKLIREIKDSGTVLAVDKEIMRLEDKSSWGPPITWACKQLATLG